MAIKCVNICQKEAPEFSGDERFTDCSVNEIRYSGTRGVERPMPIAVDRPLRG
jgi:hypothetical protein